MKLKNVIDFDTMLQYLGEKLEWDIDTEDFDAEDYMYELSADDLGIKEEEFANAGLYQMRPLNDNMPFGVFAVVFEKKHLQRAALRKILSKLVKNRRNDLENYPTWNCKELIFFCFWGEQDSRFLGVAKYDDNTE